VNIYKKSGSTWALNQTFLHTPGSVRKFGGNMSLRNNVLAVTAEREDNGATTRVGAVFVYKRNDANSNFTQIGKVFPPDGASWMDFGNSTVATKRSMHRLLRASLCIFEADCCSRDVFA
jgi:hypothetical protein